MSVVSGYDDEYINIKICCCCINRNFWVTKIQLSNDAYIDSVCDAVISDIKYSNNVCKGLDFMWV